MNFYGQYECGHEKFDFPSVKEVCEVTHEAGGYVVLAHPCNYYKDKTKEEILEKLDILKNLGIDGVECYYPANSELMTETCLEFCKKNDCRHIFLKKLKNSEKSICCKYIFLTKHRSRSIFG